MDPCFPALAQQTRLAFFVVWMLLFGICVYVYVKKLKFKESPFSPFLALYLPHGLGVGDPEVKNRLHPRRSHSLGKERDKWISNYSNIAIRIENCGRRAGQTFYKNKQFIL